MTVLQHFTACACLLLLPSTLYAQQVILRHYTIADGVASDVVTRVFEDSRGFVWVATTAGLSRFDGDEFVTFGVKDGLPAGRITAVGETNGRLWLAHVDEVFRAEGERGRRRFVAQRASRITSSPRAPAPVTRVPPALTRLTSIFDDRYGDSAPLVVRGTSTVVTDIVEDRTGTIWIATSGAGVFVVPREPIVSYSAADELPDEHVLRIVESRDRRIYALTRRGGAAELKEDGVEAIPGSLFAPFHTLRGRALPADDGGWWFWTDAGAFSAPGPALSFSKARPLADARAEPPDGRRASFEDSHGALWTPLRGGGVSRCASRMTAVSCVDYAGAEGMGHVVTSMAEDSFGRVYVGTTRGLFRFEPSGAGSLAASPWNRLIASSVTHCMRDSRGRMWIATTTGVAMMTPRPPASTQSLQVYVTEVHGAGTDVVIPPQGAIELPGVLNSRPDEPLRIAVTAPGTTVEDRVHYQYRLVGLDPQWSAPAANREVSYSRLPPRAYRFEARAIVGAVVSSPAVVNIYVPGQAWPRWWGLMIGGVTLIALRSFRKLQRADGGGDLSGMPLRVLGRMEEQSEDGRRQAGTAHGAGLTQR